MNPSIRSSCNNKSLSIYNSSSAIFDFIDLILNLFFFKSRSTLAIRNCSSKFFKRFKFTLTANDSNRCL